MRWSLDCCSGGLCCSQLWRGTRLGSSGGAAILVLHFLERESGGAVGDREMERKKEEYDALITSHMASLI